MVEALSTDLKKKGMVGQAAIEIKTDEMLAHKKKKAVAAKQEMMYCSGCDVDKDFAMKTSQNRMLQQRYWDQFTRLTTWLQSYKDKLLLSRKCHDVIGKNSVSMKDLCDAKESFTD